MCEGDKQCGPCAEAAMDTDGLAIVQAEAPAGPMAIWGPFSVEVPSLDNKLVRLAAIEHAMGQLLRRGRMSVNHHDQLVGEIHERMPVDTTRLPSDPRVQAMVREVAEAHDGALPTGFVTVTQGIASVFPKLKGLVGESVPFLAGSIYDDGKTAKLVQADIRARKLDSFSITGTSWNRRVIQYCGPDGCKQVEEIPELDLSTVTITSSRGASTIFGAQQAQNPGAAFVIVQQAGGKASREGARAAQPAQGAHMSTATIAAPAVVAQGAEADEQHKEDVLVDVVKRLGEVEQTVATLRGNTPDKPAQGAPETPTDEEAEDEEKKDMPDDKPTDEQKPAETTQAAPTATAPTAQLVMQAVADALKPYVPALEALKQAHEAKPAPAKSAALAKPAAVAVTQAKTASTPDPTTPGDPGASDSEFTELVQAADAGNAGAGRELFDRMRARMQRRE